MKICLFAFGKLKAPGLRTTADYYKRLARSWTPIEEIELKPLSIPEKNPILRKKIQLQEGELLLGRLKSESSARSAFYLLDETGKTQSTQAWAQLIKNHEINGLGSLSFCIGSSLGFSADIRKLATGVLSLGPQTFPHELARVILLEQIYRAQSVLRGHPYHNDGS